jgi:hypothetical protein
VSVRGLGAWGRSKSDPGLPLTPLEPWSVWTHAPYAMLGMGCAQPHPWVTLFLWSPEDRNCLCSVGEETEAHCTPGHLSKATLHLQHISINPASTPGPAPAGGPPTTQASLSLVEKPVLLWQRVNSMLK